MFGSVGEWFFKALAGLQPDPDMGGCDRRIIRPQPVPDLSWARGEYRGLQGLVSSAWKIAEGKITLDVTLPPNTSAAIHVPAADPATVRESGEPASQAPGVKFVRQDQGAAVYQVGSGQYHFTAPRPK